MAMNIPHYHINIFWDDAESCFVAEMPDLKHCVGQGIPRRKRSKMCWRLVTPGWTPASVQERKSPSPNTPPISEPDLPRFRAFDIGHRPALPMVPPCFVPALICMTGA